MVFGIPVAKLVPEIFKALTKPMVNSLKKNVRKSPFWKDSVFIPMAQGYNKISIRIRLWTQGITRNKEQVARSAKMSDEAALELGAEMVANFVTFAIGLMAIIMQQSIASATEKKKEEDEMNEDLRMETSLHQLRERVVEMTSSLQDMEERLNELNQAVTLMKTYSKNASSRKLNAK